MKVDSNRDYSQISYTSLTIKDVAKPLLKKRIKKDSDIDTFEHICKTINENPLSTNITTTPDKKHLVGEISDSELIESHKEPILNELLLSPNNFLKWISNRADEIYQSKFNSKLDNIIEKYSR